MEVIVKNPDILGGTPVFRGTRVPVRVLFDYLAGGVRTYGPSELLASSYG